MQNRISIQCICILLSLNSNPRPHILSHVKDVQAKTARKKYVSIKHFADKNDQIGYVIPWYDSMRHLSGLPGISSMTMLIT